EDLLKAANIVGFPAVLKPVSGAASLGVKKVESLEDLKQAYGARHSELGSIVISSGALVKVSELQRQQLQKKLLELLCQDLSPEQLQAAGELLEALSAGPPAPALETEAEAVLEVEASQEMRDWWLGHVAPDWPDALAACQDQLRLSCRLVRGPRREVLRRPIAHQIFPSAKLLAKLVLSCPELVAGKSVLELGAGFHGAPSLAAQLAGAAAVVATERDGAALERLAVNTKEERWDIAAGVEVRRLDWQRPPPDLKPFEAKIVFAERLWEYKVLPYSPFKVVLAADTVHELHMGRDLLGAVSKCLAPDGVAVVVNPAASFGVEEFQQPGAQRGCWAFVANFPMSEVTWHVMGKVSLVEFQNVGGENRTGKTVAAQNVIGERFLLESYLDGEEVDVDVVMSDGEWQYAAVSDNGPTLEPYFNETWAVSPSLLPRKKQVELREMAVSAVKALGFQDGIFHVELKYTTQHGAQLIEVNARMGGGPVYSTNRRTWGVCLIEEALFCSVGIPARPSATKLPLECIANADVNVLCSGRLVDLNFMKPLLNRKGVISTDCHVKVGEEVVGPKDGLPTWLVEVVVSKPTPREALDFLLSLEDEVQAQVHVS
ncbi:unnamed protein product, partial [Effrenium voratum]